MSRAFTKEADCDAAEELGPAPLDVLPAGARNYMTPAGAQRLRQRRARLANADRPTLARAATSDPTAERRLRELDRDLRFLDDRLARLEIVDPAGQDPDSVAFGAIVTVADEQGHERTYQICGVDETDPEAGRVSWISPIARALRGAAVGDEVELRLPRGEVKWEVVSIRYE